MNRYRFPVVIFRPSSPVLNLLVTTISRKYSDRPLKLKTAWRQTVKEAGSHSRLLTSEDKVVMEGDPPKDVPSAEGKDVSDTRRKAPFGTRYLTDPKNVFQHNAWDNVVWDEEQEMEARHTTQEQLQHALSEEQQEEFEREADAYWDKFYNQHQNRFFKDRHWLFIEFPELYSRDSKQPPTETTAFDLTDSDTAKIETGVTNTSVDDETDVAIDSEGSVSSQSMDKVAAGSDSVLSGLSGGRTDADASSKMLCESKTESEQGEVFKNSLSSKDKPSVNSDSLSEVSTLAQDGGGKSPAAESLPTGDFPGAGATFRLLEVGCGVGNTVFPVLSTNKHHLSFKTIMQMAKATCMMVLNDRDPGLMMYCCDFSSTAVQLVKEHPDYDPKRCHAFVWDITDETATLPFPPESLDIIILIFVLSAVHPDKMQGAVNRLASCLKPGGQLLFRDYGRYDMAQLRFKKGRCLSENFYVRGDGTRCYFFTQEELRSMFTEAGLEEAQNLVDRRLQVNRGRQIKMYRVWVQCKYRKPLTASQPGAVEQKAS